MQLREEEYSEQLTLVDFYYQGVTWESRKYTSQDQWCVLSSVVHAVYVCVIYCMYQIYKIAPRHSQTWQNSIGFAALLGLLQTQSNECQSICQLLFGSRKKSHYFMLCQLH